MKNLSDENKQTQSTEIKEDYILQYLPQDIVDGLDEKCLEIIQNANEAIAACAPVSINDNESASNASNYDRGLTINTKIQQRMSRKLIQKNQTVVCCPIMNMKLCSAH